MELQESRSPNPNGAITASRDGCPGESPDAKRLCLELLENFTGADICQLRNYAAYRLERVGLNSGSGEDVLQDSFEAILTGLIREQTGRHPRMNDVENKSAFIRYLKGVVNSKVEAERRKLRYRFAHPPLDCDPHGADVRSLTAAVAPENDVVLRTFRDEFFKRLKAKISPRWRHLVDGWEAVFLWAEQIPLQGRRRRVRARLRSLSREVLQEMNEELGGRMPAA